MRFCKGKGSYFLQIRKQTSDLVSGFNIQPDRQSHMYTCGGGGAITASSHWFVFFLFLFFFRLPGNIKLGSNPTFYRSPNEYFSLLQKEIGSCLSDDGDEDHHRSVFELSRANSVSAYVKVKMQFSKCDCVFVSLKKIVCDYDHFLLFRSIMQMNFLESLKNSPICPFWQI